MEITDLSEPVISDPILSEIRLNCVHMTRQPFSHPVVLSQATYIGHFEVGLDTERCRLANIDLRELGLLLARSLLQCKEKEKIQQSRKYKLYRVSFPRACHSLLSY